MVPPRSRFHGDEPAFDPDFLQRVQRREPQAMGAFFERYYDRVYAHVVNLMRDPVRGQDVCQDVFLKLHHAVAKLDPRRDPTPWVFAVASNAVRDHWRSRAHTRDRREQGVEDLGVLDVAHPDRGVQAAMEKDQELRAVWSALHSLGEDDREVILLRDYEELETKDVADMLGITPEAVRQRHSRAVRRLGEEYRRRHDAAAGS